MAHVLNPPVTVWATDPDLLAVPPPIPNGCTGPADGLDTWRALRRYLLVGGVDRALAQPLPVTVGDAHPVRTALAEDSLRVVAEILAATAARPSRPEPLLLALALAAAADDDLTRRAALTALPRVARTAGDLFLFATFVQSLRGWGRGLRRAVGAWYNDRTPADLIEDVLTTPAHAGWRHADLLRLGHPKAPTLTHDAIYRWLVTGAGPRVAGTDPAEPRSAQLLARLAAASAIADLRDETVAAALIATHRLPLASVPEHLLREPPVWAALLPHLPLAAVLAALPDIAALGCLVPGAPQHDLVRKRLTDQGAVVRAGVEPLAVIAALRAYEVGHSAANRWAVDSGILSALGRVFDLSCQRVETDGHQLRLRIPADIAQRPDRTGELSPLDVAATLAVVLSRHDSDARIEVRGAATLPLRLVFGAGVDDAVAAIGRLAARTGPGNGDSPAITLSARIGDTERIVRFGSGEPGLGCGPIGDPDSETITMQGIDTSLIATILGFMRPFA